MTKEKSFSQFSSTSGVFCAAIEIIEIIVTVPCFEGCDYIGTCLKFWIVIIFCDLKISAQKFTSNFHSNISDPSELQ